MNTLLYNFLLYIKLMYTNLTNINESIQLGNLIFYEFFYSDAFSKLKDSNCKSIDDEIIVS